MLWDDSEEKLIMGPEHTLTMYMIIRAFLEPTKPRSRAGHKFLCLAKRKRSVPGMWLLPPLTFTRCLPPPFLVPQQLCFVSLFCVFTSSFSHPFPSPLLFQNKTLSIVTFPKNHS